MKSSRAFCSTPSVAASAAKSEPGAVATGFRSASGTRHPAPGTGASPLDLPASKTKSQLGRIWKIATDLGMTEDERRDVCEEASGQRSLAALSKRQADRMIVLLGGKPFLPTYKKGEPSLRTKQLHRQKAKVLQIETQAQLDLIRKLAELGNISEDGWQSISARQNRGAKIPTTTKQGNNVVEALKSMLRRKGISYAHLIGPIRPLRLISSEGGQAA